MINLIYYEEVGTRLYSEWMHTDNPDVPVTSYYGSCELATELNHKLIRPFRKELIETIMLFGIEHDEAQQIQHLYLRYNQLNNPECMEAIIIELYLLLIEDYMMPFHAVVRIVDGYGNMLFITEESDYD